MDRAIVYFTRDGSTAIAAEYLAKKTADAATIILTLQADPKKSARERVIPFRAF